MKASTASYGALSAGWVSLGSGRPGSEASRSAPGPVVEPPSAGQRRSTSGLNRSAPRLRRFWLAVEGGAGGGGAGVLARSARFASAEDRYLTAATRDGKKRLRTHGDLTVTGLRRAGRPASAPAGSGSFARGRVLDPAGREELPGRLTGFDATLTRAGGSRGRARANPRRPSTACPATPATARQTDPIPFAVPGTDLVASEAHRTLFVIEPAGAKTSACQRRRHDVTAERANRGRRRHGPACASNGRKEETGSCRQEPRA